MIKKIYEISGFDCPNCAAKAENHLSKNSAIQYAHLDFSSNKLFLTFKKEPLTVEEILKIVSEVESDSINLVEKGNESIKKVFNISGFDCPVCASKTEEYLKKQENVESAKLDFANNKLYISFKNNPWNSKQLAEVISHVESNKLKISEKDKNVNTSSIFNKRMWLLLARIFLTAIVSLACVFALAKENLNWIRFSVYCVTILIIGYDVFWKVILHIKHRTNIIDHNLLISIAALGSLTLSILELTSGEQLIENGAIYFVDESFEAVMVITLFQIGSIIEQVATNKSKSAIMSAVELRVDKANLVTNEGVVVCKPIDLKVDDLILITSGEMIPVDAEVIDGSAFVDTSSLTGEYIPVKATQNIKIYSGCIIKSGTLKAKVLKPYSESTVSKIIKLIESGGEKKSKADVFISKFAKFYTPIIVALAVLTLVIGGFFSSNWPEWVHTGLEVLVIGCPCAIVISVPLAYFSGIGLASKFGIVVKGTNYLDELARLGKLITDKTGTLTHGSFSVQIVKPNGVTSEELMNYILAAECLSNHPIGKAICHGHKVKKLASEQINYSEIPGLGAKTSWKGKTIIAGGEKMMNENGIQFVQAIEVGSVIYCAVDNRYIGYVVLADTIKDDAQPMVDLLHSEGVEIILLTGDHEDNAKEICNKIGIDRWHSELLPEQKTIILEKEMKNCNKAVAFIGDGINDAPSIIRSDIGIAMGGIGSDIAVENADIVIMNDDPAKVYDAMVIAKKARATSIFNIAFALCVKGAVFISTILTSALMPNPPEFMMYIAVLSDTGLTVILVINSLLLLYSKIKRKTTQKKEI